MGIFLQEMVLDLPGMVVAQPVGELDLAERILQELVLAPGTPRPRELVLVEDAAFHGSVLKAIRRLDRSAKRGAERPSLHDKPLIVERRSLRSGRSLPRAKSRGPSVETTGSRHDKVREQSATEI